MTISIGTYTTLPDPSEEDIEFFYRGTSYNMANGQPNHDNISTTAKQRITLSWKAVNLTNRNNIYLAALSCLTSNRTYVDIRGDTTTVTLSSSRDRPKSTSVPGASLRYNVTIILEEI
jgi:hypothetical protein